MSMPNMDKMGPRGKGPATGRGMGNCSDSVRDSVRPCGRGCGRRRNVGQRGFNQNKA